MISYLEETVAYYNQEYRNGRALITDKKFDKLERNLLRIDPNYDFFNNKNNLILPSLPKDNIEGFLKDLLPDTRLLIEPKIDGCAIAIRYIDGRLDSAITRDGNDVSRKIKAVKDLPKEIPIRSHFVVRGELFATEERPSYSQKIPSRYLRSADYQPDPKISFCAFQIINTKTNEYESLVHLKSMGFAIPEIVEANRTSQVQIYRDAWLSGKLFKNYPNDGIVIKINSRKLQLIREKSKERYSSWQMAINY